MQQPGWASRELCWMKKKQMHKGYILLDAIYIFLRWQNFTNVDQWLSGFMKGRGAGGNWVWQ